MKIIIIAIAIFILLITGCTIIKKNMPAERSKQKSIIVAKTIIKEYQNRSNIKADTTTILRYEVLTDPMSRNKINVVTFLGKAHPEWYRGITVFIDKNTEEAFLISFQNGISITLNMEIYSDYKEMHLQYTNTLRANILEDNKTKRQNIQNKLTNITKPIAQQFGNTESEVSYINYNPRVETVEDSESGNLIYVSTFARSFETKKNDYIRIFVDGKTEKPFMVKIMDSSETILDNNLKNRQQYLIDKFNKRLKDWGRK